MTYRQLIEYTHWANERYRNALTVTPLPEADRLYSHILHSSRIWLSRLEGHSPTASPWETIEREAWPAVAQDVYTRGQKLAATLDPEQVIPYTNTQGQSFHSKIGDLWLHLSHHGAYHRAQMAQLLRRAGHNPPVTDYIVWQREVLEPELGMGEREQR